MNFSPCHFEKFDVKKYDTKYTLTHAHMATKTVSWRWLSYWLWFIVASAFIEFTLECLFTCFLPTRTAERTAIEWSLFLASSLEFMWSRSRILTSLFLRSLSHIRSTLSSDLCISGRVARTQFYFYTFFVCIW